MRVWSLARKMRAGARKPKECSETARITCGRNRRATRTSARSRGRPARRPRARPVRSGSGASSDRRSSATGGRGDRARPRRRPSRPASSATASPLSATTSRRPHRPRRAVCLPAPSATAGFLRRFLPPRLPRRVFRFTTTGASPSSSQRAHRRDRASGSTLGVDARLGSASASSASTGTSPTASWITSGDDSLRVRDRRARGSRGARRRLGAFGFSAAAPFAGSRLGRGLGSDELVGTSTRRRRLVGCGSSSPSHGSLGRGSGAGRLAPAAAAARAAARPLLRGRRSVGRRLAASASSSDSVVDRPSGAASSARRRPPRRRRPRGRRRAARRRSASSSVAASSDVVVALARRRRGLPPGRSARRLLGLALERDRPFARVAGGDERGERLPLEHPPDRDGRLLADELRGVRDEDVDAVDLARRRRGVVAADLAELELDGRALDERRRRLQVDELALGDDLEVIGVDVPFGGHEEEATARRLLDRGEPRAAGAGEELEHARVQRHAVRLNAVAGRGERPQPPLDLHRDRVIGDDDAVAGAGRALARQDLARAVGDVLARHLDEAERRDLDDVGLRPVALELLRAARPRPRPGSSGSPCR